MVCKQQLYITLEDDILEINNHKFVYFVCPICASVTTFDYDYLTGNGNSYSSLVTKNNERYYLYPKKEISDHEE